MDSFESEGTGSKGPLPPPPPVPPNVEPVTADQELPHEPVKKKVSRVPIARLGLGSRGSKIPLLANHFKVNVSNNDGYFFHYSVSFTYEDGCPVEGKGVGRKIIDKVQETYDSELERKDFAYDGEKSLFTVGPLPRNKLEFTVVLEDIRSNRNKGNGSPDGSPNESDRKRMRRQNCSKTFKVEISYAAKIPLQAIASALRGQESENFQEAIRVLDIVLRQHAAKQGCLLVRQSFFHNDERNFFDVGGGVQGCRGFHSSFRTTQSGLSLNMDVSTTMIIKQGPVVDFLTANQNERDPYSIDWAKAKRTLKNLRIKTSPSNQEYKITGLSDLPCKEQMFFLKKKNGKDGDDNAEEVTVFDYFVNHRKIDLSYSADFPCINVGKPKRPIFFPLELCSLVSLQRYTKSLSTLQRVSLVEESRRTPQERRTVLSDTLKSSKYDSEPVLRNCGVSISTGLTQVEGRILQAPRLMFGSDREDNPRNGRWNLNNKKILYPMKIERWAVVNFSARCNTQEIVRGLMNCCRMKGVPIDYPLNVFEEDTPFSHAPPLVRVNKMFGKMTSGIPHEPSFILCLLRERKSSELYGPWKQRNLCEFGVVTQCIAPTRVNDQYLTNVLMKINAKLGGLNSLLSIEHTRSIPIVSKDPTLILGMDVSHGSPGQSDIPSIAAVVSSRQWPLISKYRAWVSTQSPKVEMMDNLFKRVSEKVDEGIIRGILLDFYSTSENRKPQNIIIFRDGVSESQFNQVLNIELNQIIEACKFLDDQWSPKFVVIVAQRNHHTRFFQPSSPDNVRPGTVVDNKICHPQNYDFYLCAHAGMIGTSRPTHYHVLLDEVGFSADDLQQLVHSLSYVYQRSTTAVSVVAPICYAHLAATQMRQMIKFEDRSETSSSHSGSVSVPQLPKLDDKIRNSMFFC